MYNWAFVVAVLAVVIQALVAYLEENLTQTQMIRKGIFGGFPFVRHLGMWSDLFLLPFVIGTMYKYQHEWSSRTMVTALVISALATAGMHYSWIKGTTMQEHILSPSGMTSSGWLHAAYMTWVLATIMVFYYGSSPSFGDMSLIAILLAVHVAVGTMGVSIMKIGGLDTGSIVTTVVVWVLLAYSVFK